MEFMFVISLVTWTLEHYASFLFYVNLIKNSMLLLTQEKKKRIYLDGLQAAIFEKKNPHIYNHMVWCKQIIIWYATTTRRPYTNCSKKSLKQMRLTACYARDARSTYCIRLEGKRK